MSQRMPQQRPTAARAATTTGHATAGPTERSLNSVSTALNTAPTVQRLAAMTPNRTGLPDTLKAGVEAMSGISMDHVRVHRNSAKPAQLNAHAYAQGSDIHLAPGQEKHLPHEAWHVVQQAQGRVKPTMQMKGEVPINDDVALEREADEMGMRASRTVAQRWSATRAIPRTRRANDEVARPQTVAQCVFVFQVNTHDYTVKNGVYYRTQGKKYMTGNAEAKHVTADTLKSQTYNNVEGITLVEMADRVIAVANTYINLPGTDLIDSHQNYHDNDMEDEDAPSTIIENNFKLFKDVDQNVMDKISTIKQYKLLFESANEKNTKDGAAFHLQNEIIEATKLLEEFRDLMPLVNIISGLQKRGNEPEANHFLKTGLPKGGIDSNWKALWAYFDFAAIDEIASAESLDQEEEIFHSISDALPWLSIDQVRSSTAREMGKNSDAVTMEDIANYLSALMIANHIKLTLLSYPLQAAACDFATKESVENALSKHDSPVNQQWVAKYAIERIHR